MKHDSFHCLPCGTMEIESSCGCGGACGCGTGSDSAGKEHRSCGAQPEEFSNVQFESDMEGELWDRGSIMASFKDRVRQAISTGLADPSWMKRPAEGVEVARGPAVRRAKAAGGGSCIAATLGGDDGMTAGEGQPDPCANMENDCCKCDHYSTSTISQASTVSIAEARSGSGLLNDSLPGGFLMSLDGGTEAHGAPTKEECESCGCVWDDLQCPEVMVELSCCCVTQFCVTGGWPPDTSADEKKRRTPAGEERHNQFHWEVDFAMKDKPGGECTYEQWEMVGLPVVPQGLMPPHSWNRHGWNPSHEVMKRGRILTDKFSGSQRERKESWMSSDSPGLSDGWSGEVAIFLKVGSGCTDDPECKTCCVLILVEFQKSGRPKIRIKGPVCGAMACAAPPPVVGNPLMRAADLPGPGTPGWTFAMAAPEMTAGEELGPKERCG